MNGVRRVLPRPALACLGLIGAACAPAVRFYEGKAGSQNRVCRVKVDRALSTGLKNYKCKNDEIRSAKLRKVPADTYVRLYGNEDGEINAD